MVNIKSRGRWLTAARMFLMALGLFFAALIGGPGVYAAQLPVQNACPDGQEKDGALCYPKCNASYNGVGPVCWQVCPAGYTDIGIACTKVHNKASLPRGVGTVPTNCPSGQVNDAGLCYPSCKAGDTGVGPVCYGPCPAGTTDIGLICSRTVPKTSYGRGAGTLPNVCGSGRENQAGLCYPSCRSGYYGVGPVCWQSCRSGYRDDGLSCFKNLFDFYFKDSYGRGAGTVPNQCPSGRVNNGGLCYTACNAGFTGVGPVCWQVCPSGTTDTGAFCESSVAKNTYTRGVGVIPSVCAAGKENQAGLCYDLCPSNYNGVGPVCWENCPSGYADKGLFCDLPPLTKDSYGRGAGQVPPCFTGRRYDTRYTAQLQNYLQPEKFTLIIASDPQFPWWRSGKDADCNSDDCILAQAKRTNRHHVQAMNTVSAIRWNNGTATVRGIWPNLPDVTEGAGSRVTRPLGVIMNGDLTAYWHDWQKELYRDHYELGHKAKPDHAVLRLPIFPGLGNHDYANNLKEFDETQGCYGLTADSAYCAKDAVKYIKNMVYCDNVKNFINTLVQKFDQDSLAYSYDIGHYHFVQLNNYPTYVANSINIKSAIGWLKTDLAEATDAGKKIVLNFHDYGDHMKQNNAEFLDAIKDKSVVALFAGHTHRAGYVGTIPSTSIPVFRSGSAEHNRFLLVEFGPRYINVGEVSSTNGIPRFVSGRVKTYPFPP